MQVARRPQAEQHLAAPLVDAGGQPARRRPRVDARRDRAVRDALGDQVVDLLEPAPVRASRRARGRRRCGPSTATSRSRPPSWRGSRGRRPPRWRTASRPVRDRCGWPGAWHRRRHRPGRRHARTPARSRLTGWGSSSGRAPSRRRPRGRRRPPAAAPLRPGRSPGRRRRGWCACDRGPARSSLPILTDGSVRIHHDRDARP